MMLRDAVGFPIPGPVLKSIAWVVLFTHLFVFYSPSVHAIDEFLTGSGSDGLGFADWPFPLQAQQAPIVPGPVQASAVPNVPPRADEQMAHVLRELADLAAASTTGAPRAVPDGLTASTVTATGDERLRELRSSMEYLHGRVLLELEEAATRLREAGASRAMLERHEATLAGYLERYETFLQRLDAVERAHVGPEREQAYAALSAFLEAHPFERRHRPLDPHDLPQRIAPGTVREPRTTDAEFAAAVATPVRLASTALTPGLLAAATDPLPEDLLPDEHEVQITPGITDLAASLDNNPVRIYEWVRNNVAFTPTYGSVQGAQMTMEARRGNAADTAALLIALLRSANVPARFVLGTIEIPTEQALNWVGGVESVDVAQQLLGQGGVPNVAIIQDDTVTHLRVEHVWVEAWLDYVPSRGARNLGGDRWVALDPSFKQYDFGAPSSLLTELPLDVAALNTQLLAGGAYDPELQRYDSLDQGLILDALEEYQLQQGEFARDRALDMSEGALLGRQDVLPLSLGLAPPYLPYDVVAQGPAQSELPSSLRHYVNLRFFASELDRAFGGADFSHRISLPMVNSHRLGVTYEPATAADAALLESLRSGGGSSLPLSSIRVKPVVKLDDETLASGTAVTMGTAQFMDVILEAPDGNTTVAYDITAGDEMVVGVNGNGVSEASVHARFAAVPSDTAAENLHQVALHYWMEYDYFDRVTAKGAGVHVQRLPSVGVFSSPLTVTYLFGLPSSGYYQSRVMDVKHVLTAVAGTDPDRVVQFRRQSGVQGSFLEGSIFDQLFGKGVGTGISAVQLLADANAQGIPVYNITGENLASVLPALALDGAVEADIVNSVNAGMTVVAAADEISRGDWVGTGYVVTDPTNGTGAYLISGGLNGGGLIECIRQLVPVLVVILVIILLILLYFWLAPLIAGALAGAGAGAPAFVSILLVLFGISLSASPAYASGLAKGGKANPCCPDCPPPPPCEFDQVPPSRPHYPCPGDHWHYYVYNQNAQCQCFLSGRLFGGCGAPPVPCPPGC